MLCGLLARPLLGALVHRHRQLHLHLGVEVTRRAALRVRQAEAPEPDLGTVLRLGRNLELHLAALQSRRRDLATLERDVEWNRHHDAEGPAFARAQRTVAGVAT